MRSYLNLLNHVFHHGQPRNDRTGVGTVSVFAPPPLKVDLKGQYIPLLTTKKMNLKPLLTELEWFLRDDSDNTAYLHDRGVKLWDAWADEDGDVGPIYGHQWRRWGTGMIDQLADVVFQLKANPMSRRLLVSAWNVDDLNAMSLPPCPVMFQLYVRPNHSLSLAGPAGFVDMHVYQRSADIFLGVPFDIAQYAILLHVIAADAGYAAGALTFSYGDLHLYKNHRLPAGTQLLRQPYGMPTLELQAWTNIDNFTADRVTIRDYKHHPALTGKVAV